MTGNSDVAFPRVLIITGAMAAGKSSVAQGVAERLEKAVHLRGDLFRRMIVSGQIEPTLDRMTDWKRQLDLRYELAWAAAERYAREGFTVVYQDILNGALSTAVSVLAAWKPGVVVLCPSPEVLSARDALRVKTGYKGGWTPEGFDALVRAETPKIGLWLDTSAMSVSQAVDFIVGHPEATRVGLQ